MAKQRGKGPIPCIILGTDHDQNPRPYEQCDAHFLFNKVVARISTHSAFLQIENGTVAMFTLKGVE